MLDRWHTNFMVSHVIASDVFVQVVSAAADETIRFWKCFAKQGLARDHLTGEAVHRGSELCEESREREGARDCERGARECEANGVRGWVRQGLWKGEY